ncbi:hypothetical protein [Acidisarcina polymorpha]|uniref:hypothetical protein n=1 Tax=Acidisarcina polymorpha TaxID=2211140 RepID=UPI001F1EEA87|nr:hypothetical protein [Acidisarcina polymorpha]
MMDSKPYLKVLQSAAPACILAVELILSVTLTGCMVVGGYSSGGGWFLWPGGLGVVSMILLILFVMRRRR